jgi:osmotically-inducible protein OsmY
MLSGNLFDEYPRHRQACRVTVLIVLTLPIFSYPAVGASAISDADITAWVKDALYMDVRTNPYGIQVFTNDGIVSLDGTVDNLAAKEYAVLEARRISGVLGVVDLIKVVPAQRSDTDIRYAVRRRILNSDVLQSEGISVMCVNAKVTLTGIVDSYAEKEEAGLLASQVRGVKEVENNIVIQWMTERSDSEIRQDAISTLQRDVYLTGLPITVTVKGGIVTLQGSVGSAFQKDRAAGDVRWIANVNGVSNELEVKPLEERQVREDVPSPSDAQVLKAVREDLAQDIRLSAANIRVQVTSGVVTLDGTVASAYERRVAEQDAYDVVGVGWVNNNLAVQGNRREDWAIRDDVQFELNTDAATEGLDIGVKVNNGIVTLTGDVPTWYQKARAEEIAAQVASVRAVANRIHVLSQGTETHIGAVVAGEIQQRFKANWALRNVWELINVTVEDGVATLTGQVDTLAQRREAGQIAFNAPGVWKVDNRLQVKGYNYNWQEWNIPQSH